MIRVASSLTWTMLRLADVVLLVAGLCACAPPSPIEDPARKREGEREWAEQEAARVREQGRLDELRRQDQEGSARVRAVVEEEEAHEKAAGERRALLTRQMIAEGNCRDIEDPHPCGTDGIDERERQECEEKCALSRKARTDAIYQSARKRCIEGFTDSNGKKKTCDLTRSPSLAGRQAECDRACVESGRRWQRYLNTRELCCDGSRSPSCTYGTARNGCCSHHGGVCAEPEPE